MYMIVMYFCFFEGFKYVKHVNIQRKGIDQNIV